MTEGGARIERYVPAFPLSQEVERLERVKKSLAVYRMALGWPRQEDAADFVARISEGGDLRELMNRLMLDLSPRGRGATSIGEPVPREHRSMVRAANQPNVVMRL